MKAAKKSKKTYPEVHIHGDLQDAVTLVSGINKKKTLVIFNDGEQNKLYCEKKKDIQEIRQEDISKLEKDHRLIHLTFFPGLKAVALLTEEKPEITEPEKKEVKDDVKKNGRKGKKEKRNQKENIENTEPGMPE